MNNDANNTPHYPPDMTPAALLEQLVYVDTFMPEIDDPTSLDDRLTAELAAFVGDSFVFPDEDKPKLPKEEDDDNGNNIPDTNKPINGFNSGNNNNDAFGLPKNNTNNTGNANTNAANTQLSASDLFLNPNSGLMNSLSYNTPQGVSMNQMLLAQQQLQQQLQQQIQQQQIQQQQQQQQLPSTAAPTDILSVLPKVTVPPGAKSSLIAAGLSTTQIDALAALIAQHETSKNQNAITNLATSFSTSNNTQPSTSAALNLTQQPLAGSSSGSATSSLASSGIFNPFSSLSNAGMGNPSSSTSSSTSAALAAALGNTSNSDSGVKRRTSSINSDLDLPKMPEDEESTGDPELDKRKRNTAASARFRIKKKLKEQQLERSVRELTELTMTLEKKIQTLEMENRLLRNLVVEKGEQRNNNELEMLKQRAKMASDAESGLGHLNRR